MPEIKQVRGKPIALFGIGGVAFALAVGLAVPLEPADAGTFRPPPVLTAAKVGVYGAVLGNSRGLSLYVLDHGGKVHSCTGVCLDYWPPLLVPRGSKVTVGKGVKGHVHWVVRGDKWQLTYNGWPVYTYVGDSGAHQHNGEGLYAFGGTWYLVSAAATSKASTPDKG